MKDIKDRLEKRQVNQIEDKMAKNILTKLGNSKTARYYSHLIIAGVSLLAIGGVIILSPDADRKARREELMQIYDQMEKSYEGGLDPKYMSHQKKRKGYAENMLKQEEAMYTKLEQSIFDDNGYANQDTIPHVSGKESMKAYDEMDVPYFINITSKRAPTLNKLENFATQYEAHRDSVRGTVNIDSSEINERRNPLW